MKKTLGSVGLGAALALAGCQSAPSEAPASDVAAAAEPVAQAPAYEQIAPRYAARVRPMSRLWTRVTARYWGEDASGNPLNEMAEGHLQVVRPDDVALSLGKLGETYLYLGSNPEKYWWIDLLDADNSVALVGTHAEATPRRIAALGLPVRPPDLIELLGVTEIAAEGGRVDFGEREGELIVTSPRPVGWVRLWVDQETLEPRRIALLEESGDERIHADLEAYQRLLGVVSETLFRVPRRAVVNAAGEEWTVRLTLNEPRTNHSIRDDLVFNPDRLFQRFGVKDIIDLDERVAP
ncbi:MAG: hypothetical protein AAGI17_10475 [Planctomycetota bacterium]